jgi:Flp pilus assembly protein TadG
MRGSKETVIMLCCKPLQQRERRRGAATVEFAILLPFLILLFIAAVDFARLYFAYIEVSNAARNGCLWLSDPYATGTPTQSCFPTVTAAALADCPDLQPPPTVTTAQGTTLNGANQVTTSSVTVTYNFQPIITNFPFFPLGTIPLTRTETFYNLPKIPS